MRNHHGDDMAMECYRADKDAREYVEQLEDKLEDALQQLRDASPIGSKNLRAALDKATKELSIAKNDIEKFKVMLQANGVTITKLHGEIKKLRDELITAEKHRDNADARIEDLVKDIENLEKENQRFRAAAGINDVLIVRRSL